MHDDIVWAHDNYLSRRFPVRLSYEEEEEEEEEGGGAKVVATTCASLNQSLGVMLPLFDLLNHSYSTDIDWEGGTSSGVSFHCGVNSAGIAAGEEVFNNYGNKGNEQLMLAHGFCIQDNVHDSYGLKLLARMPVDDGSIDGDGDGGSGSGSSGGVVCVGVFWIFRSDNPDVMEQRIEQIPSTLWRAIGDAVGYLHESDGAKGSGEESGEESGEVPAVVVACEDVEMLLQTLQGRLVPFTKTKDVDVGLIVGSKEAKEVLNGDGGEDGVVKARRRFVAMYRDGQRRVLEDVIQVLKSMLGVDDEEDGFR